MEKLLELEIKKLHLYQPIDPNRLGKIHKNEIIKVYKINGVYIVADGNHRIYEAMEKGLKKVNVKIVRHNALLENNVKKTGFCLSAEEWFTREGTNLKKTTRVPSSTDL